MGREAEGHTTFRGLTGAVKAVLESDALILRGEVRVRLARTDLAGWRVEGDDLRLLALGEPLVLTLGTREAAAWVRALDKPLPTLAAKMGLSASSPAHALGAPPPPEIAAAMVGAVAGPAGAALLVAVMDSPADLDAALAAARVWGKPVWCVYRKGKAVVGDAAVRAAFRAAGWMDTKSCAVSADYTATLYRP